MRYVVLMLIFFCFVLIGFVVAGVFKSRKMFFESLIKFCDVYSSEIKFSKNSIVKIIDSNIDLFDENFKACLLDFVNNKELKVNNLTKNQMSQVREFFNNLGELDVSGELEKVNRQKSIFFYQFEKMKEDVDKKGNVYFKLISIAGVLVTILLF